MLTASDMQATVARYLGANADAESVQDCREAINDALVALWAEHEWPWYSGSTALLLNTPYSTGTVTYVASTRTFTLTGGTFPTWAIYGTIRIGSEEARVTRRNSSTSITVEDGSAFTSDLASATSYTLFRGEYPLEGGLRKIANVYLEGRPHYLEYLPSLEFHFRRNTAGGAVPRWYTVQKDRFSEGELVLCLWPYPDQEYSLRYQYMKTPTLPLVWSDTDGKVTVTSGDATVTGDSTAFETNRHTGAVIRIGRDATNVPTSREGRHYFSDESIIESVTSTTSLEMVSTATYTRSTAVKYEISSLIDIDPIMREVFTQRCYLSLAARRGYDAQKTGIIRSGYQIALRSAMVAASTSKDLKYAGNFGNGYRYEWIGVA